MDAAALVLCFRHRGDRVHPALPALRATQTLEVRARTPARRAQDNCRLHRAYVQLSGFSWRLDYYGEGLFARGPGITSAPVSEERTAWRVPDLGKTMCQKLPRGTEKPTPMYRSWAPRFCRTDVT